MGDILPFVEILKNPNSAWALLAIVLVVYVMRDGGQREVRLTNIIDTTIKEHGTTIQDQTKTLDNINTSLLSMKDVVCDVKSRVEEIETMIGIKEDENKND